MRPATAKTALRVQELLGPDFSVLEFDERTATSEEAAAAIGCTVSRIAKTVVFQGKTSGVAIVAVASGVNRVDDKVLAKLAGEKLRRPSGDLVKELTGYAIGGVSPVGLPEGTKIYLDRDIEAFEEIWASAGTPNAVFKLTPKDLSRLTEAFFAEIKKS